MPLDPKQIKSHREKIESIENQKERIDAISKFDDKTSLPILIDILEELKSINEKEFEAKFKQKTEKELPKNWDSIDDFFTIPKAGVLSSEKKFDSIIDDFLKKNINDITEKNVNEFVEKNAMFAYEACTVKLKSLNVIPEKGFNDPVFLSLLKNQIYILFSIKTYKNADWMQNLGKIGKVQLAPYKTDQSKIRRPYIALNLLAAHILKTEKTQASWDLISHWLKGLHKHVHDLIKPQYKDQDGNVIKINTFYPTIEGDEDDASFKSNLSCTKYDIALYHRQNALAIDSALDLNHEKEVVSVTEEKPAEAVSNKSEIKEEEPKPSQPVIAKPLFTEPSVEFNDQDDCYEVVVRIPKKMKEAVTAAKAVLQANKAMIAQGRKTVDAQVISNYLAQYETSEEQKIWGLKYCIDEYNIPCDRFNLRQYILSDSDVYTNQYLNPIFSIWNAPKFLYQKVYGLAHSPEAEKLVAELEKIDNPRDQLLKLYELRKKLDKEQSKTLLPAIDKALIHAFDYLRGSPNKAEQIYPQLSSNQYAQQQMLLPPPSKDSQALVNLQQQMEQLQQQLQQLQPPSALTSRK